MKRRFTYCFIILLVAFASCEDIYDAKIETRENVIVADARIVVGMDNNIIRLSESKGFNDNDGGYLTLEGATVTIVDNNDTHYNLPEIQKGLFQVNFPINSDLKYKIQIEFKGDSFESEFEAVQNVPALDSVYGFPETRVLEVGGDNDVDGFWESIGAQLYADINENPESPYFRFTSRKIMQFTYEVPVGEVIETMYAWKSFFPKAVFNIASPPEYSSENRILKHPLYFMEQEGYVSGEQFFAGWILILYPSGISKSAHGYYADLNNQLESDGKLFDPLYVQARNNLRCTSNPKQLILGNFEISTMNEYRFFVNFVSEEEGYLVKPIPYFYTIPLEGESLIDPPDFWEYGSKPYPDE